MPLLNFQHKLNITACLRSIRSAGCHASRVILPCSAAERGEVCPLTLHPEPALYGAADLPVCLQCREEEGARHDLEWAWQGLEPRGVQATVTVSPLGLMESLI